MYINILSTHMEYSYLCGNNIQLTWQVYYLKIMCGSQKFSSHVG
jgi:hypothetical protein